MKVKTGLRLAYILSDYLIVTVGWLVFNIMRFYTLPVGYSDVSLSEFLWHFPQVVAGEVLIPPMMVVLYALSGFYNEMVFKSRLDDINNTLAVSTFGALIIYFVVLVNDSVPERMRIYETLLILIGLLSVPTMLARMTVTGPAATPQPSPRRGIQGHYTRCSCRSTTHSRYTGAQQRRRDIRHRGHCGAR